MSYDLDDIIEHYGVKGMKWGVRKAGKSYMDASRKHEAKTKARRESQNAKLKAHKEREREYAKTVTKNALQKVGKMNARRAEKQDAYHDKKMKSSKVYKSIYDSTPKYHSVNGRDRVRQRAANAQYRGLQANVAMMAVGGTMAAASSKKGQKIIKSTSNFVSSGQAQKIGKNVLNTVMGNPLRYVNAENMKNVVVNG